MWRGSRLKHIELLKQAQTFVYDGFYLRTPALSIPFPATTSAGTTIGRNRATGFCSRPLIPAHRCTKNTSLNWWASPTSRLEFRPCCVKWGRGWRGEAWKQTGVGQHSQATLLCYHSTGHNLVHEDHDMMRAYNIVGGAGVPVANPTTTLQPITTVSGVIYGTRVLGAVPTGLH